MNEKGNAIYFIPNQKAYIDPISFEAISLLWFASKHLERPKSAIFGTILSSSSILLGLRSK
jgi:hypothetical protein